MERCQESGLAKRLVHPEVCVTIGVPVDYTVPVRNKPATLLESRHTCKHTHTCCLEAKINPQCRQNRSRGHHKDNPKTQTHAAPELLPLKDGAASISDWS